MLVCAFVLVLLLSILFKRYHRIIMWSAAIVFFIGTLLLIGLGIIDPVKDNNHPDPVVITGIFTALVLSGVFAYGAEKLRIKLKEKNQQTVQPIDNHSECTDSPKGVVLSGRLDTSLARTIFAKAIEAGYIEEVGSHYSWKGTKAANIAQKINADCVPYFVTIRVMVGQTNAVQRGTKTRVVNSADLIIALFAEESW